MSIVHYDLLQDVCENDSGSGGGTGVYLQQALDLKRTELDISRRKQTFKQRMQILSFLSPYLVITTLSGLLSYGIANLSKEVVLKLTEVVTLPVQTATHFLNYMTWGTAYHTDLKVPANPFSEDILRYTHLGMTCIFVFSFLMFYGLYQLTCIQELSFLGCKIIRCNTRHRRKYHLRKTQKLKREKRPAL